MPKLTQDPIKQIPHLKSIANLETLTNLIYFREVAEIKLMKGLMAKKIMEEGKAFFDVWMYEVSDEIQSFATAFAERFVLESALAQMATVEHAGAKQVLASATYLHCISLVAKNIDWYLLNGIVSVEAAQALDQEVNQAVKAFVPHMNTALEGFPMAKNP